MSKQTNLYDYESEVKRLSSIMDTEVSFDFQCDETLGFPTCLCWNREEGKAWISPNERMAEECEDKEKVAEVRKACENFGIRNCESVKDFNAILRSLGEDAAEAQIYEDEDMTIC